MVERTTVFVKGKVYWAKIIGEPRTNYEGDGREWAYDFEPEDTSFLKEHKLLDRLKEDKKGVIKGEFLHLKKPELDKDGKKNTPIRIYNNEDEAWDDRLLGNGTTVVAKLSIVDWGKGKKKSIYTTALRVEELVPYVSNEFGAYDKDDTSKTSGKKAKAAKAEATGELDELDDDVPF